MKQKYQNVSGTVMRISLLIISIGLAGNTLPSAFATSRLMGQRGPAKAKSTETVKLIDRATGKPIANSSVHIISDNGIRCITAPCPTNSQEWRGTSDRKGRVTVPSSVIQSDTYIEAGNYKGRLSRTAKKGTSDVLLAPLSNQ